jgi:hypothetical protein
MKRSIVIVGLAAAVAGCSGGGMNNPFKKYSKDEQMAATAARGYTEVKRENVIYVVSSPQAVKRVNEGKEPAMKVAAIGFGPRRGRRSSSRPTRTASRTP